MKLKIYQQIYTKLFKKLELDKFLHYDLTDYKYRTLEKTDYIIPFDEILINVFVCNSLNNDFNEIHKNYNPKKHRNKLIKEINKSLKHKELNVNEYLYIFMNTINSWIEKYSLQAVYNLTEIFSDVMEFGIFYNIKENLYSLFNLGLFTIVDLYDRNKFINNLDEWILFLQIQSSIFDINTSFIKPKYSFKSFCIDFIDITTAKERFKEYINFIGLDEYKQFLNNLYCYIILIAYTQEKAEEKSTEFDLKEDYEIFVTQCEYSHLLDINQIEEVLKIFVKFNLYEQDGLDLLKEYNSSYVDEYESLLLMKDLLKAD